MKIKAKSVLRISLLVIAAVIIGLNVYSINASRLGGDKVPMPFGVGVTVVLSGSMEPRLSTGDLLFVVSQDQYNEKDIVVFQTGHTAVVHEIIEIEGDTVITKGMANNTEDDPIQLSQIKGKVVLDIPLVGYLVNIIKTPAGTIILLAAAVLLLECSFRKKKEEDSKKLELIKAEIEALKNKQNDDNV